LAGTNGLPQALAASTNSSSEEMLKPEEAEQALKRLREPTPSVGTWRRIRARLPPDPNSNPIGEWDTTTNVVFVRRLPDGRFFVRKEITRRDKSGTFTRRLYVRNEEGYWAVLQSVAVLYPQETVAGKDTEAKLFAWWTTVEEPEQTSGNDVPLEKPPFVQITGERFKEGDLISLRITQSLAENAFTETAKKAKKKIPFFIRPFITISLLERWFAQAETFRLETILDESTGELIGRREYGQDGSLHFDYSNWSKVEDLPVEAYSIPSGLKLLRPKTIGEAIKLERQFRAKESRTTRKRQPPEK
jgi:hypothetical protein